MIGEDKKQISGFEGFYLRREVYTEVSVTVRYQSPDKQSLWVAILNKFVNSESADISFFLCGNSKNFGLIIFSKSRSKEHEIVTTEVVLTTWAPLEIIKLIIYTIFHGLSHYLL